jgi:cell division protein FtsQ
MQQIKETPYKDPAPSRASYRMQRVWLTPVYRSLIRTGLPIILIFGIVLFYAKDPVVVQRLSDSVSNLRSQIENRPEFTVKLMRLQGASAGLSTQVRAAAAVEFPISSFRLDLDALKTRIEQIDAVKQAALYMRAGGLLDVEITERRAAVVWRTSGGLELLDVNGVRAGVLATRSARADLPLIAGVGANDRVREALEILEAASPVADRLRGLLRVGERRWDLVLDRNQIIQLPEVDPVAALERVIALQSAADVLARDVLVVDMRDGRRPVLRLSAPARNELLRLRAIAKEEDA